MPSYYDSSVEKISPSWLHYDPLVIHRMVHESVKNLLSISNCSVLDPFLGLRLTKLLLY